MKKCTAQAAIDPDKKTVNKLIYVYAPPKTLCFVVAIETVSWG